MIKVDVLARDGSPLGVSMKTLMGTDPKQVGCGGAELAILTFCENLTKMGHKVTFYNNPRERDVSPFEQKSIAEFSPEDNRDYVMFFRSPNPMADNPNLKGKKIWWSHDQYTIDDFASFAPKMDKIVVNSPCHAEYFRTVYHIENTVIIDEPARTWEYENIPDKVPGRCIFTSVPDRGLTQLLDVWPEIMARVPFASLVVTSDYRLWGVASPQNQQFVSRANGMNGITFLGAVPRPRMVEETLKAQVLAYPSNYQELFCYAVVEAELSGAIPITSDYGALGTTNMGIVIPATDDGTWKKQFVDMVCKQLINPDLRKAQDCLVKLSRDRFSTKRIMNEWMTKIFV